MSWIRGRGIVLAITAVAGFFMFFPYYFNVPIAAKMETTLQNWSVVLMALAMGYGLVSMTIMHSRKIASKREGWQYSIVLLASMYAMAISGAIPPFLAHPVNQWLYNFVQARLQVTIFAMLAPFVASAAYRAFRVRSKEAAMLFIAALFVMLGNAPIGVYLWNGFYDIGNWFYLIPNVAAQRGIIIGIAVGTIAIGVRVLTGYEKAYRM